MVEKFHYTILEYIKKQAKYIHRLITKIINKQLEKIGVQIAYALLHALLYLPHTLKTLMENIDMKNDMVKVNL